IDNGDGSITRVQCKTGILRNGVILFRTYNADGRRPHGVRYFGQVDAFGVYCPQMRRAYLVPLSALATSGTAYLRVGSPRNGQARAGVRTELARKVERRVAHELGETAEGPSRLRTLGEGGANAVDLRARL